MIKLHQRNHPRDSIVKNMASIAYNLAMATLAGISSASIPFSLAARNRFISKTYSMTWFFGLPFGINTHAPDDVHNLDSSSAGTRRAAVHWTVILHQGDL